MSRILARLGVVATVSAGLLLGSGVLAGAHVTVHSSEAVQGGTAEIAFQIPTESDNASTVKVAVAFPTDTPIPEVSVLPHPGWTYKITRTTLPKPISAEHGETVSEVVGQIEWTATGPDTAVKPGEYEAFRVSAGPLPSVDRLVFKVLQTYDDGQVVRWIDGPAASGAEPDHPAAVLPLAPAGGVSADAVARAGHTTAEPAAASGTASVVWWALAVIAVAVLATLWAVLITIRTTRRKGGDTATV